jgi:hypothetical protein
MFVCCFKGAEERKKRGRAVERERKREGGKVKGSGIPGTSDGPEALRKTRRRLRGHAGLKPSD